MIKRNKTGTERPVTIFTWNLKAKCSGRSRIVALECERGRILFEKKKVSKFQLDKRNIL